MKINAEVCGIAGDWHGAGSWVFHQLYKFSHAGINHVFQVGDFGLWHGYSGNIFLNEVEMAASQFNIKVYVTLGNHENYDVYDGLIEAGDNVDDDGVLWVRPHIAILPRPFLFEIGGRKVASLGGAPSIDFALRTVSVDWWPQEVFTDHMLEEAKGFGKVDIVLAHDAPSRGSKEVENIVQFNPQGWSRAALDYCKDGRDRMDAAMVALEPELWFHGHYHVSGQGFGHGGSIVTSLDKNGQEKANISLNLDDMEPTWL